MESAGQTPWADKLSRLTSIPVPCVQIWTTNRAVYADADPYTILRLRTGARLTRYRDCKFHNFARTISRHADGISRYSVPPSAGPLLPLVSAVDATLLSFAAERRPRSSRSISPARWVHSSSERNETGEWWDGRTDRRTDGRQTVTKTLRCIDLLCQQCQQRKANIHILRRKRLDLLREV